MFVQTHSHRTATDSTVVFRDVAARVAVIAHSAHRGGCLYLGSVTLVNQATGRSFRYSSTHAHGQLNEHSAAAIYRRHAQKIS
jgi:hypothetical protein